MTKFEILKPALAAIQSHISKSEREGYFAEEELEIEIGDSLLFAYINYDKRFFSYEGSHPDDVINDWRIEHIEVLSIQMWDEQGDNELLSPAQKDEIIFSLNQALNSNMK
jgi:hypothetical protein